MKPSRISAVAAAAVLLLTLAGCGSTGGLGDILGGSQPTATTSEIRGTVDYVDTGNRFVVLQNVSQGTMLSNAGNTVRVHYDNQTTVEYQGRNYRPEDLERGDQVAVRVQETGSGLVANTMTVLYDSSSGTSSSSAREQTLRGTVRYVDTARREIGLEQTSWGSGFTTGGGASTMGTIIVQYDTNTRVEYSGQLYPPANLERGDVIDVQVDNLGGSNYFARRISVVRDVNR